jgi:hypothetical protein
LFLVQIFLLILVEEEEQIDFILVLKKVEHVSKAASFSFAARGVFSPRLSDASETGNNGTPRRVGQWVALN